MNNLDQILIDDIKQTEVIFGGLKVFQQDLLGLGDTSVSIDVIDYDVHKANILNQLQENLKIKKSTPIMAHFEVLMAKYHLLSIVYQQLAAVCNAISPTLSALLDDTRVMQDDIIMDMYETAVDISSMIDIVQKEVELAKTEHINYKTEKENDRKRIDELTKELNLALTQADSFRSKLDSNSQLIEEIPEENIESPERWWAFTGPPDDFLDSNRGDTDTLIDDNLTDTTAIRVSTPSEVRVLADSLVLTPHSEWEAPELWLFKMRVSIHNHICNSATGSGSGSVVADPSPAGSRTPSRTRVRPLSIQQCKEIMRDVVETRGRLLKTVKLEDTIEHQVYRLFEKRYGLFPLVVRHAASFLTGLRHHAHTDVDCAVFLALFRNQVDESYLDTLSEAKERICGYFNQKIQLERQCVRESAEFRAAIDELMSGTVTGSDANILIEQLFHLGDRPLVISAVKKVMKAPKNNAHGVHGYKAGRNISHIQPSLTSSPSPFQPVSVSVSTHVPTNATATATATARHLPKASALSKLSVQSQGQNSTRLGYSNFQTPLDVARRTGFVSGSALGSGSCDGTRSASAVRNEDRVSSVGRHPHSLPNPVMAHEDRDRDDNGFSCAAGTGVIPYTTLVSVLLFSHLHLTRQALFALTHCFQFYDADADGVLSIPDCCECLRNYCMEAFGREQGEQPQTYDLNEFDRFLSSIQLDRVKYISFSNAVYILRHLRSSLMT